MNSSKEQSEKPPLNPAPTLSDLHLLGNENKIVEFADHFEMVDGGVQCSVDVVLMLINAIEQSGDKAEDLLWKVEYALFTKTTQFAECLRAYQAFLASSHFTWEKSDEARYKALDFMAAYLSDARKRDADLLASRKEGGQQ